MKHCMMFCENQAEFNAVSRAIEQEGWILDPAYDSKLLKLDNAIVFPLVKYETDIEKVVAEIAAEELNKKQGELDDVNSLISVDICMTDSYIEKGYKLLDRDHCYAKTVIMIKRKEFEKIVEEKKE